MIVDLMIAGLVAFGANSFLVFFLLMGIGVLFAHPDKPYSSGLFRVFLLLSGLAVLMSLFGGDDCDLDV